MKGVSEVKNKDTKQQLSSFSPERIFARLAAWKQDDKDNW